MSEALVLVLLLGVVLRLGLCVLVIELVHLGVHQEWLVLGLLLIGEALLLILFVLVVHYGWLCKGGIARDFRVLL